MVTDASGSACWEADYYPYGQEKTPASFSDTCSTHYKFTGYERDPETDPGNGTGNDYAFARYYSPRLGRFMSADPSGGDLSDPQTLNKYAYTRNNPINLIDPSGMDYCSGGSGGDSTSCQNSGGTWILGNCNCHIDGGGGDSGGGGGDVSGYSNWGGGILVWLPGSCDITGPCNFGPALISPAPPPPTPAEQKGKSTKPPPPQPNQYQNQAEQQLEKCKKAGDVAKALGASATINTLGAVLTAETPPVAAIFGTIAAIEGVGSGIATVYAAYVCFQQ